MRIGQRGPPFESSTNPKDTRTSGAHLILWVMRAAHAPETAAGGAGANLTGYTFGIGPKNSFNPLLLPETP